NTSTRLADCSFALRGDKKSDSLWVLSITNPNHNHELSKSSLAHPSLRRLDKQALEELNTMSKAGIRPQQIFLCDIHHQWWIEKEQSLMVENYPFDQVLNELRQKYNSLLAPQQEIVQAKLLKMIQEPPPLLLEPTIARTRGRPTGSQNNTSLSTRRISSAFEKELKTTAR
ncbi:10654_t:CDS:2, partial [Racocetra fulgida]